MTATKTRRSDSGTHTNSKHSEPKPRSFEELGLSPQLCSAVRKAGYTTPTPIQAKAIPRVLNGHDLLGCARTGTGKTAAFALPLLQMMLEREPSQDRASRNDETRGWNDEERGSRKRGRRPAAGSKARPIRTLVLAPTRELAAQIDESFAKYSGRTDLRTLVVFGGVGKQPQINGLRRGTDVLVATPGRLLDLCNDGHVDFDHVEFCVLDEADRMLDMGFIHDVRKIISKLPSKRQNLMFSATMPNEIQKLANRILFEPIKVAVDPVASTALPVSQSVYGVERPEKTDLLIHLLRDREMRAVLVFTRTKHGADKVVRSLRRAKIEAVAIHGNKSQSAREKALSDIKTGEVQVLVATDIAARGIDVKDLSHVVNFDLPNVPESYVHRIGRTGRAGTAGAAIAFCSGEEREFLADIEKLTRFKLTRMRLPEFARQPKPTATPGRRGGHTTGPARSGRPPRGRSPGQSNSRKTTARKSTAKKATAKKATAKKTTTKRSTATKSTAKRTPRGARRGRR